MNQTHKSGLTKVQMFDEKFAQELISSNTIKDDFFLLFSFFQNYGSSQMHQTFHQTLFGQTSLCFFLVHGNGDMGWADLPENIFGHMGTHNGVELRDSRYCWGLLEKLFRVSI